LLEALKALLPEGWGDDDTMDHMPGVKLARLAIARQRVGHDFHPGPWQAKARATGGYNIVAVDDVLEDVVVVWRCSVIIRWRPRANAQCWRRPAMKAAIDEADGCFQAAFAEGWIGCSGRRKTSIASGYLEQATELRAHDATGGTP